MLELPVLQARSDPNQFACPGKLELRLDSRAVGFDRLNADIHFFGDFAIIHGFAYVLNDQKLSIGKTI